MVNKYFTTRFAISTIAEAELLAQRNVWNIIEGIRQSGTKGITLEHLSQKLKIPRKILLPIVKDLIKINLIGPKPLDTPEGTIQNPSAQRLIWNALDEPMPWVENDFFNSIRSMVEEDQHGLESLVSFVERIIEKVRTAQRTTKYFPTETVSEPDDASREAAEFVDAVFASIYWCIMDRGKDRRIMMKYGWATEKYFKVNP